VIDATDREAHSQSTPRLLSPPRHGIAESPGVLSVQGLRKDDFPALYFESGGMSCKIVQIVEDVQLGQAVQGKKTGEG
jgi:hypothetical protein